MSKRYNNFTIILASLEKRQKIYTGTMLDPCCTVCLRFLNLQAPASYAKLYISHIPDDLCQQLLSTVKLVLQVSAISGLFIQERKLPAGTASTLAQRYLFPCFEPQI